VLFRSRAVNYVVGADASPDEKDAQLAAWRFRAMTASPGHDDLVALAWADTRLRYDIPYTYCKQLIDGVARDLHQHRYESFDDLATYCYGVASTVGLMMLRIIGTAPGFTEEEVVPYAIKMGLALQITNILRDVGEDWQAGRVYLPANELRAWGLSEIMRNAECGMRNIPSGPRLSATSIPHSAFHIPHIDGRWRDFMRFQVERNRALYREAWPCIKMFAKDGRFCVAAMCSLYSAILDDIETHDYDVFGSSATRNSGRAHVSTWGKLRRLPGIWWRNQGSRSGAAGR